MARQKAKILNYDWRDVVAAMVPLREYCIARNAVLDTRLLYHWKPDSPTVLSDVRINSVVLVEGRQIAAYTSSLRTSPYAVSFRPTADFLVSSIAYLAIAVDSMPLELGD